jgi:hypothetical protein
MLGVRVGVSEAQSGDSARLRLPISYTHASPPALRPVLIRLFRRARRGGPNLGFLMDQSPLSQNESTPRLGPNCKFCLKAVFP